MAAPAKFTLFKQLPVEIQSMIWRCHREQRGVRHYITESPLSIRHYAAIDIETNLFARTLLTRGTAKKFWTADGVPRGGESDGQLRLIGDNYVPEAGDFARSVTTARHTRAWRIVRRPQIRINYVSDVVLLEATYLCIRPAFPLRASLPVPLEVARGHWLHNVRHLALGVASCRHGVEGAVALLASLRSLRLVVYRDPACRYGAPRTWRNFKREMLDVRNFLPFEEFRRMHPDHDGIECDCETGVVRVREVRGMFVQALENAFVDNVVVSVVADPY